MYRIYIKPASLFLQSTSVDLICETGVLTAGGLVGKWQISHILHHSQEQARCLFHKE